MKKIFWRLKFGFSIVSSLLVLPSASLAQSSAGTAVAAAQTPSSAQAAPEKPQPRRPTKRATTPPARVTVIAGKSQVAPQVVTIVHRLTGMKMLRYLLRQGNEGDQVFTIDPEAISNDAHASIIAGWALDDGKTIAARLPQAGAEIEFGQFPMSVFEPGKLSSTATAGPPFARTRTEPDLTVITNDGRRLRARYVGLDGQTGLSVLQVNGMAAPATVQTAAKQLAEGQQVQLFAPERTTPDGEVTSQIIYVKVAVTEAKISNVARTTVGGVETLTVRSANLSPVILGGVACDEAGNTLGIVDAFENNDVHIVPAATIRAATRRVLERQASVPKPLLGVRGEPVDLAGRALFLANGWPEDQLKELLQKQLGILLTGVMPGTPAALAKLHPGDVIVSVNQEDVKSAEEFSKLLGDAGSGAQVQFAVRRPGLASAVPVDVKLGGSFDSVFEWRFEMPPIKPPSVGLNALGIETATLSWDSVSQLGTQTGLLVVAVQPESAAARSGIREGDVIESIDGRRVGRGTWVFMFNRQKKHVFSVVRNKEKKQIVVESLE
jgi:S1-C subfamily serine protease